MTPYRSVSVGAVHEGKFYLTSTSTRDEDEDDMRIYDFTKKEWEMLTFGLRPEAAINSFVTVSGDQLVQYGGSPGQLHAFAAPYACSELAI